MKHIEVWVVSVHSKRPVISIMKVTVDLRAVSLFDLVYVLGQIKYFEVELTLQ